MKSKLFSKNYGNELTFKLESVTAANSEYAESGFNLSLGNDKEQWSVFSFSHVKPTVRQVSKKLKELKAAYIESFKSSNYVHSAGTALNVDAKVEIC